MARKRAFMLISPLLYLLSSLWIRIPASWRRQESIEETSTRRTGGKGGEVTIGREQAACPSHLAVFGLYLWIVCRFCRLANRSRIRIGHFWASCEWPGKRASMLIPPSFTSCPPCGSEFLLRGEGKYQLKSFPQGGQEVKEGEITIGRKQAACPSHSAVVGLDPPE